MQSSTGDRPPARSYQTWGDFIFAEYYFHLEEITKIASVLDFVFIIRSMAQNNERVDLGLCWFHKIKNICELIKNIFPMLS